MMTVGSAQVADRVKSDVPAFGQIVGNLDLRQLGAADVDALKIALAACGVMIFRDQTLDDTAFVDFLSRLGPMIFTPGETPLADHPMLNAVSNVGRVTPPRSVFHTDSSYLAQPPAYTALRAVTTPRSGGATIFSNQYAAADTLPATCRTALAGRTARHRVTGLAGQDQHCRQPLLRRHPVSGRTALFLTTPERCDAVDGVDGVDGVDDAVSRRLVNVLYRRSIRSRHQFAHHWRGGDIVIWDDRCTMHRADHSGVIGDRVLHRGMVGGETPVFGA
jgi:taurine dioxygenase